ncbi:hypothetical protein RV12_GL001572 [Enterococcus quebecensis]|uniref:Uncharacterized protein n=2 Tax=Enterococcus quebecensis TaxID=903983 RepID=A0A1E5H1S5_9ENTE|nr:hypothetical protein BCR23_13100 [Enterococcus quebecensis]OJG71310.1 hypothetical protein RV12_GL001572 [Enterococcus quebecensis]
MKLMNVEEGSLIAGLKIAYSDIIVPAIPLIIENKEIIWNSIKSSYEFLKAKITAAKEGKELTITQTTDTGGNNFLVKDVSDSTVNIYVYPGVDRLADELSPEFASMAKMVDGDQISSVEFTNSDTHDDFKFTPEDKELFSRQTYTEDSVITITGKIYGGDFKSQSGKIDVISSSDFNVVSGDMYPFKINGNLDTEETWKEMFLEEKTYFCKKRIEINTTKNPIISVLELIIIDFDTKQEIYETLYLDLDN